MRLLSAGLIHEKNQLDSANVWTMCFQLTIEGAPGVFRLVNYDQDITFAGLLFERFPCDVDSLQEATSAALVNIRLTIGNVDQQMQSLLENYWSGVADPLWLVTIWQINATTPDQTAFGTGEIFSVTKVDTDLITAIVDLQAEGITLSAIVPKRRYTTSSGFAHIPRR